MIQASILRDFVREAPFRPFRLHMASGTIFDVPHPEVIQVGKTYVIIANLVRDGYDAIQRFHTVSIMLVEYVDYMEPEEPF